ncbi:neuropeptide Y receptor type 4-like [Haliotis rubra]|uniref:neuropeptide Y receptor type 4-like n=1 Tax=Haliotis rubra TaxID=36100 RepID=UPI001EE5D5BB|nr:neuropeptide Y receptor type 4-like [Haliotis rubra]
MDNRSSVTEYLQSRNDEYALENLVAMIFLGLIMFVGFVGNCLVFLVYLTKMKPSTTRCFILALSTLDFATCLICIPVDIVDIRYKFTFGEFGSTPCKLSAMFVSFTSFASGNILVAVAAVRHKKVCYPTGPQTSIKAAFIAIFLSCVSSFTFSIPPTILYGGQTKVLSEGVNATLCTTSDFYVNTRLPLAYNGFQFVLFVAAMATLSTLYVRIWKGVARFADVKKWSWKNKDVDNSDSGFVSKNHVSVSKHSTQESVSFEVHVSTTGKGKTPPLSDKSCLGRSDTIIRRPSKRQRTARRTTLMLFIISLAFVVSFLPHLTLMAVRALHRDRIENLAGPALAAYNIFLRSYFINCAANPFIYSYCNVNVRKEIAAVVSLRHFRK